MKKRIFLLILIMLVTVFFSMSVFASDFSRTVNLDLPLSGTLSSTRFTTDGQTSSDVNWITSPLVLIPQDCVGFGYTYTSSDVYYFNIGWFTSSQTFISAIHYTAGSSVLSIPTNAAYVRFCYSATGSNTFYFKVLDKISYTVYYKDFSNSNLIYPSMTGSEYVGSVISLTAPEISGYTAYTSTYDLTLSSSSNEYTFYYQAAGGGGESGGGGTTYNVDLSGVMAQLGTIIEKMDSFFGFTVKEFLQKPIESFTVTEGLLLLVVLILLFRLIFSIFNR